MFNFVLQVFCNVLFLSSFVEISYLISAYTEMTAAAVVIAVVAAAAIPVVVAAPTALQLIILEMHNVGGATTPLAQNPFRQNGETNNIPRSNNNNLLRLNCYCM